MKSLKPVRTAINKHKTKFLLIIPFLALTTSFAFANTPASPILTVSSFGSDHVDLSWTSSTNSDKKHKFQVYMCQGQSCNPDKKIKDLKNTVLTFSDTGLQFSTTYGYMIREKHDSATNDSNIVYVTTLANPNSISLTISSFSFDQVVLDWTFTGNTNEDHKFKVLRCEGLLCNPNSKLKKDLKVFTYTDTTVQISTTYGYMIEDKINGIKIQSNVEYVTTPNGAIGSPPNIILFGANPLDLTEGDGYTEYGASAIDPEDGILTNQIMIDSSAFKDKKGNYDIIYTVTDSDNNTDEEVRLVRVCKVGEVIDNFGKCIKGKKVPQVDIFAELDGRGSILVEWHLPSVESDNFEKYNFEIERSSDNGNTWTLIKQHIRDTERKVLDHDKDYRQLFNYLDTNITKQEVYKYRILSIPEGGKNQGQSQFSLETPSIFIPRDISGYLIKAEGHGIESTTSGTVQPPLMLGWFAWIMPNVFAVDNPIFTSMLNPQNEVFEIQIEPIPIPTYTQDICKQALDISFKRNSDGGQTLQYTATVLENGIPKHQFFDKVQITAKRVFNNQYYIPFDQQTITDFNNISVQIDVNSGVGDPRAFELYSVDFYVPEDNGAC